MAAENQEAEKGLPRILAVVNDLFFVGKITAAAQRTGVPVEFVRGEAEVLQKTADSLAMLLLDMNDARRHPISLIAKLKADPLRKEVRVIGYLSHVQEELKREADQAGCDLVLPKSVFSQQLDDLLRQRSCHL
jgi:CheY-like chemotaxis protein